MDRIVEGTACGARSTSPRIIRGGLPLRSCIYSGVLTQILIRNRGVRANESFGEELGMSCGSRIMQANPYLSSDKSW